MCEAKGTPPEKKNVFFWAFFVIFFGRCSLIPVDLLASATWCLRSWQFSLEIYEPSMYFNKNLIQKRFVKSPKRSVVKICQANSW